jgi:hypothetical protein
LAQFRIEPFLKARNRRIEAQDFRRKTVLGAKFLRPRNPTLEFVLCHGPIQHV